MGGVSGVSAVTLLLLLACGFYGHLVDGKQFGPGFQQLRKLLQVDAGGGIIYFKRVIIIGRPLLSVLSCVLMRAHSGLPCTLCVDVCRCVVVVECSGERPLQHGGHRGEPRRDAAAAQRDPDVHRDLSCGAFSSVLLVNPRIFRRLSVGDCLLNDGLPFPSGSSISFQYANSFSYPRAITNATCVPSS